MNVMILAAGQNPRTEENAYPLCLAEFESTPLIERVLAACLPLKPDNLIVALRKEEVMTYHLDRIVDLVWPGATVLSVQGSASGAACTALLASGQIDNDQELLIISGNELLDVDFQEIVEDFRKQGLDAGVAVFHSVHPRYSYVKLGDEGLVVEASEKKPISTHATAGFYWFARGSDFVRATKNLIRKDASVNGSYYICPVFNEMVLEHGKIGLHKVANANYHPLKTERQIDQFEHLMERERSTA